MPPDALLQRGDVNVQDLPPLDLADTDGDFVLEGRETFCADLIALLEEPECVTDHFAGGLVLARLYLLADEFLELWGEGDVHGGASNQADIRF